MKINFAVRNLLLSVCLTVCVQAHSQTNISGVINDYASVSSISSVNCSNMVTVDNPGAFHSGDTVMLMQMKGAVIDTSNTTAFGNILKLNNAGYYQYAVVNHVNGSSVYLDHASLSVFDLNGKVQMIRVPNYSSANITGTLTAKKWDGSTGGVLVFFVSGSITLNADIDVSGLGFRGGDVSNNPDGGCGTGSTDFFYPLTQANTSYWDFGGAKKGEGISDLNDSKLAGKGKLANGGGGGNKHNYGGGGGANYTAAGQGGQSLDGCGTGNMGIGGMSLARYLSVDTLFMGGGGGCGDFNNNVGSIGADGGGIVIIKAGTINANGHSILAKGNDETVIGSGIADGVGGGGAGGSVYLDAANFSSSITLNVSGGHGGDQDPGYSCVGTGGGGGVGAILLTNAAVPSGVTILNYPGRAGIFLTNNFANCAGTSYGATAGDSARNGILTNVPQKDL